MSAVSIGNLEDYPLIEPEPDGSLEVPGVGHIPSDIVAGRVRWLGNSGEEGPWVYVNYFPQGHAVPYHFHDADRSEVLMKGAILWHEPGKESVRYEAPAFSYVTAGTTYSFDVLEDSEIVVQFGGPPMLNLESNRRREI